MAKPGLNGNAYRKLRVYMKEHLPWICHRCTRVISREITTANPRHREAWSADHHPIPRSQGGPSELWNLKPAHNGCNSDAGNEMKAQAMAEAANPTSQDWGV